VQVVFAETKYKLKDLKQLAKEGVHLVVLSGDPKKITGLTLVRWYEQMEKNNVRGSVQLEVYYAFQHVSQNNHGAWTST
jgi:hypothetical protein